MGNCDDCSSDICSRVEFFDGLTTNSSYLGRFCTGSSLTAVVSNGRYMHVKFYSSFTRDRGFRAEYVESFDEPSPAQTPPPRPPPTPPPTTPTPPPTTPTPPPTTPTPPPTPPPTTPTTAKPPTTGMHSPVPLKL